MLILLAKSIFGSVAPLLLGSYEEAEEMMGYTSIAYGLSPTNTVLIEP